MGNLLFGSFFRTDKTMSEQVRGGRFTVRKIRNSMTYYQALLPGAGDHTLCPTTDSQTSTALCPITSSSTEPSPAPTSSQDQSDSVPTSRPLLIFFSWLGAQPGAVAKYRDLYLDQGMDVLLVQSSVMHFLWPRWGLDYGLEVLKVLEEPQFSGRQVLVHASSIGGYTFTQLLTHISQRPEKHAGLATRVIGHIYDSLVVGTLEHMAIGLGRTLVPRFEGFVKNMALLYFWLFKTHTADLYNSSIQVFHNSPITAPALFFYSENDAMCNPDTLENVIHLWRKRGMSVESRKWKESIHAAHMRCHPEDYRSSLEKYLKLLHSSSLKAKM